MKPTLVFNNENRFVDNTDERTKIKYRKTVCLNGHNFVYVKYGIYAAEPVFEVNKEELDNLLDNNPNVSFLTEANIANDLYRVVFAYSSHCNGYNEANYVNNTNDSDFIKFKGNNYLSVQSMYSCDSSVENLLDPVFDQTDDKSRIKVCNRFGFAIEPGIYFFPKRGVEIGECLWSLPVIDTMYGFEDKEVAVIGYDADIHLSFDLAVQFLAIGRENFDRLKEIHEQLHEGYYCEIDNSLHIAANENRSCTNCKAVDLEIEQDAEELVNGLGMKDITLRFERPFFRSEEFEQFDAAYKLDNNLVLIRQVNSEYKKEIHSLQFISCLYVKENRVLNNGIEYPVIHSVIDYKEDRLKEILTPEAYTLYKKELKN